jgi:hypothetical protein
MMKDAMTIRPMREGDAVHVAALSSELGYPAATAEIRERFGRLGVREDHADTRLTGRAIPLATPARREWKDGGLT